MRHFKKSVILSKQSVLCGEYAVMAKCDGKFIVLSQRCGRLWARDAFNRRIFDQPTKARFDFMIYAETLDCKTFFAFDNSLDSNFRTRHEALKKVESFDNRIVAINATFTFSPLKMLREPKATFPCDGLVLISVHDETSHYKWKSIQSVDFFIDTFGNCVVGWLATDALPFAWCWIAVKKEDTSYVGIPFGDESGPHKFEGDIQSVQNCVIECVFQGSGCWSLLRKREDKTLEFEKSASFAGANNWNTAKSALNAWQP